MLAEPRDSGSAWVGVTAAGSAGAGSDWQLTAEGDGTWLVANTLNGATRYLAAARATPADLRGSGTTNAMATTNVTAATRWRILPIITGYDR